MDEFTSLYDRHYQDVYRFALFLSGDPTRAEDLASDTFVRAWLARDRIRQPTVRAYLLTITRRKGGRGGRFGDRGVLECPIVKVQLVNLTSNRRHTMSPR